MPSCRKSTQAVAPAHHKPTPKGQYDIYPCFPVGKGKIDIGFQSLAKRLANHKEAIIDGYIGALWEDFRKQLDAALVKQGKRVTWLNINKALLPEAEINALIKPFLGGDDPLFGMRFTGQLPDFFDKEKLKAITPDMAADVSIVYGCGASLAGWDAPLVYLDVPKNELQFRSRAGSICNLGASKPKPPQEMYKRFYFVDWIALNKHKAELLPSMDLIIDAQRPDEPTLMLGGELRTALKKMSHNYFRVRPWFEPGPWGGQWIKEKIPQLTQDVPNYSWSFELIVPENGLMFESDGNLLEVSFDMLMFQEHKAVLGDSAERFKQEFPIRFDFLDTFGGGDLSVQCHPRPDYIKKHFGENFTQDEAYYILDCKPKSRVYLGFQDDIDPDAFRVALERSLKEGTPVDVERFVNTEPAHKHDLFLIPNGTVHCSGAGNLVLEISATPHIFTFKMYDWLRMDLEGRPRPLNIGRAFENLYFERKGHWVKNNLISRPTITSECGGWRIIHLPTHPEQFYDVHRFEFMESIETTTDGSCHVMSLVEGTSVILETADGMRQRFNYAETFVVPAAAGSYALINESTAQAKVVKVFIRGEKADRHVIALDVGGTSVKSAVVSSAGYVVGEPVITPIDSSGNAGIILGTLADIIRNHLSRKAYGIAFAFPGPFDYDKGISHIAGVAKYQSIYGLDVRAELQERLGLQDMPIAFRNDAEAAIVGEARYGSGKGYRRLIGLTLGTGCGSAFIVGGKPVTSEKAVPENGWLYPVKYRGEKADDVFSIRGLTARFRKAGLEVESIKRAAEEAREGDAAKLDVFAKFGGELGNFLAPFAEGFKADALLLLGGIAKAIDLYEEPLTQSLPVPVLKGVLGEKAALLGAAELLFSR